MNTFTKFAVIFAGGMANTCLGVLMGRQGWLLGIWFAMGAASTAASIHPKVVAAFERLKNRRKA
jgi:hypothetical protein